MLVIWKNMAKYISKAKAALNNFHKKFNRSVKTLPVFYKTSLTIILLLFCSDHVQCQKSKSKKYSGNYVQVALKDVLDDVSEQTGYVFSYSAKKITINDTVSINFNSNSIDEVLDELFSERPISWRIEGKFIVLKTGTVTTSKEKPNKAKATIHGYIKDSKSKEILIGAAIYIEDLKIGTVTNKYGYYSLTVPKGARNVAVSYVGYKTVNKEVNIQKDMFLNIKAAQNTETIDELVISNINKKEYYFKSAPSQTRKLPLEIKNNTNLLNEPDVIKSLDTEPSIAFHKDGSSYFSVRGGNYDQNLILLDEAIIFNPSHLLGLFSPFIPDALKTIDIYKSGFPVKYGGKVSSVIDLRTKDGNMRKLSGSGNLSPIAFQTAIEGPIIKNKASYYLSVRRSIYGMYIKPSYPSIKELYFSDATAKVNFIIGKRDRIFLTLFGGNDEFKILDGSNEGFGIFWKNSSGTLRWNHVFGSKLFLNTTLFGSMYEYIVHTSYLNNNYWKSHISNAGLKQDLSYYMFPNVVIRTGYKIGGYKFIPGNYYEDDNVIGQQTPPVNSEERIIYAGVEHTMASTLFLNYGFRATTWANKGETYEMVYDKNYELVKQEKHENNEKYYEYSTISPRITVSLKTGDYASIKFSYSASVQHINLLNNSVSPFNTLEVWLPSGPNIKPQKSNIIDLGYKKLFNSLKLDVSATLYYKKLYNQIAFANHAKTLVNPYLDGEIRQGDGHSYGLEIFMEKAFKKVSIKASYVYSGSYLKIPDIQEQTYPSNFDIPHSFKAFVLWNVKPRWVITSNIFVSSGYPFTSPTGFYYYRGDQLPIYSSINNDRFPTYRRMDISTKFILNKEESKYKHSIKISIINILGSKNPIAINFNKINNNDQNKYVVPADKLKYRDQHITMNYLYGVMPSLNYQFNF